MVVEKPATPKTAAADRGGKWPAIIIAFIAVAIILIIVGFFYNQQYLEPFRRTIITVDNTDITMDYFLKRSRQTGLDAMAMLEALTNEQILKQEAPKYIGEVTSADINQELKKIAQGVSENITDSEFKEWYRQQLNEAKLSDAEYKELIRNRLLAIRLQEYLAERVPTIGEQVHVYAIVVETFEDAEAVKARLDAGEDFGDLAREVSLDTETGEKGGELGWIPRGAMDFLFDETAFSLNIGEASDILPTEQGFYLLKVSEKAVAREIEEEFLQVLKGQALQNWFAEERQFHEIKYDFNSEIYAWINWQLAKGVESQ